MSKSSVPLPARPHIVVCPPTLVTQWGLELHRFLVFGSFRILPYLGGCKAEAREAFWSLADAKNPAPLIILTTLQAVRADAEVWFKVPTRIRPTTFEPLRPRAAVPPKVKHVTLFSRDRQYGVIILDEAHLARTATMTRLGMAELMRLGRYRVAMSATPIVTSPLVSYGEQCE